MMFKSDYCEVYIDKKLDAIVCIWKKACKRNYYRDPLEYGLSLLEENGCINWIVDTRNGFENDEEDNQWLTEKFIPRAIDSSCKNIYFIVEQHGVLWNEITQQGKVLERHFFVSFHNDFEKVCRKIGGL